MVRDYPETTFGGDFPTNTVYSDPEVQKLIEAKGWILWPPIPYSYDTVLKGEGRTTLQPPSRQHWLGTDDSGRDVMARLIYGFRISVLFGLVLTLASTVIGIAAGAVQGYFGGVVDLLMQRFLEIWSSMFRHILPNAMTASLTFLPFILAGSVTTLTSLDFLGFGLPVGSPSLGELLLQGKNNLNAPWLAFTGFFVIALMLSLLVFIGEAVRDAFNPRKVLA